MDRRGFVAGGCGFSLGLSLGWHQALAAVDPAADSALKPDVPPGYTPTDTDERGLWGAMARAEEDLKTSNALIRDPALNSYISGIACGLGADYCTDMRVYVMRVPYFNASMAPNGLMMVWSGLLLRMRSEAQLATVIGHEIGHYLRRHSIRRWREARRNMALLPFAAIAGAFVGGSLGAVAAQNAMLLGMLANSRGDEREADLFGLQLMLSRGYQPQAAAGVWRQIIAERDATEKARGYKTPGPALFLRTHPADAEREKTLTAAADALVAATPGAYQAHRERYREAMKPFRTGFLDDQIALNDFGGTQYLVTSLAEEGWTAELKYALGELHRRRAQGDDMAAAVSHYREATTLAEAPPEAFRGLGYALLRTNDTPGGQEALRRYLALKPTAPDRAMVEFALQ
jgi:predicted Zn-dependent protease